MKKKHGLDSMGLTHDAPGEPPQHEKDSSKKPPFLAHKKMHGCGNMGYHGMDDDDGDKGD